MDPCIGCDQEKPICCSECDAARHPEATCGTSTGAEIACDSPTMRLQHTLNSVATDHAVRAAYGGAGREWHERACSAVRTAADMLADLTARLSDAERERDAERAEVARLTASRDTALAEYRALREKCKYPWCDRDQVVAERDEARRMLACVALAGEVPEIKHDCGTCDHAVNGGPCDKINLTRRNVFECEYHSGHQPREPGCQCQWEIGDSPCPLHGEVEE